MDSWSRLPMFRQQFVVLAARLVFCCCCASLCGLMKDESIVSHLCHGKMNVESSFHGRQQSLTLTSTLLKRLGGTAVLFAQKRWLSVKRSLRGHEPRGRTVARYWKRT